MGTASLASSTAYRGSVDTGRDRERLVQYYRTGGLRLCTYGEAKAATIQEESKSYCLEGKPV